ncbi:hypothetical protein M3Y94_00089300 [Aphelenchoides besseyi]|nr:hypothetical protein M3Y94_00089300 [Aphelenchoides besseyi]KAI6237705.1 hypothetical protein M3Y95_00293300 [Aphelenchoides besseyi]
MQLSQQQQLNLLANTPFGTNAANIPIHFPAYKEGVSYTKRVPNCQKCGQHGRKARLKGHKRVCPFKDCNCQKCQVVTERQKLMAEQIKTRRRQRKNADLTCQKQLNAAALTGQLSYLNLNMLYKQLANGQTTDENTAVKAEQPAISSPSTLDLQSGVQFSAPNTAITSSAFSTLNSIAPAINSFNGLPQGETSPQIASSPLSTIGTEMSLSPQIHPRAQSFDYGALNSGATGPTSLLNSQLLSSLVSAAAVPAVVSQAQSPNALGLEMTPPQSAGLVAPIPVNPVTTTATGGIQNSANLEQLAQLINLLCQQQQQPVVQPQLLPLLANSSLLQPIVSQALSTTQQPSLNDLLLYSKLMPSELSPPPEESQSRLANGFLMPNGVSAASMLPKANGFVDVLSV